MAATRSEPGAGRFGLRELGPEDDEAAWRLRGRALLESPYAFATHAEEHPTLAEFRRRQAEHRRNPDQRVLGAFDGDALVGMVTVVRETRRKVRHRAYLFGLYVAPEARGAGLGATLVDAAVRAARELGAARLELTVTTVNAPAIRLYRAAGFRVWGRQPQALRVDGRDLDELFMTLPLYGRAPEDAQSVVTE